MGRPCSAYDAKFSGEISSIRGTELSLTKSERVSVVSEATSEAGRTV